MTLREEQALPSDQELMERYGIIRAPTDYFLYRGYRYSTLKDAVAQVERDRGAPPKTG